MSFFVRKRVQELLKDIDTRIKKDNGHEWVLTSQLCNHFGIDGSRPSRDREKYQDVFCQGHELLTWEGRDNRWFIRVDYIPWWIFKTISNHAEKSGEMEDNVVNFLNKIGIAIPKGYNYVYFLQIEKTREIKVGSTSDLKDRKSRLKRELGSEIKTLKEVLINKPHSARKEEDKIKLRFKHLLVDENSVYGDEIFSPENELMDFIKTYEGPEF